MQPTASDINAKFRSCLQWMLKTVTQNSVAYSKNLNTLESGTVSGGKLGS